jgi:carbonic anhydrase/acetyltransferase-like protein (isoleucine patch superfamily)
MGVGATVLNSANIGSRSLIAANASIPRDAELPAGSLVAEIPGKVRRALTDGEQDSIRHNAAMYLFALQLYSNPT